MRRTISQRELRNDSAETTPALDRGRTGVLDTSVVIALEQLSAGQLPLQAAISAVTLAELAAGPTTDDEQERARRQDHLQRGSADGPAAVDAASARMDGSTPPLGRTIAKHRARGRWTSSTRPSRSGTAYLCSPKPGRRRSPEGYRVRGVRVWEARGGRRRGQPALRQLVHAYVRMLREAAQLVPVMRVVRGPGPPAEVGLLAVVAGLPDLGLGVHHERPVLHDRLSDRAPLQHQEPSPVSRSVIGTSGRTTGSWPPSSSVAPMRTEPPRKT